MDKDKKHSDPSKRFDQQEAQEKHRRQAGTHSGMKQEHGEFSQQEAEEKHRRQAGKEQQGGFRQEGQHQAEHASTRQQGGWSDKDMHREGSKPAMERDWDYNPDGDSNKR